MLRITIPELELFNEETETFITGPSVDIELEHSLASLSKWESKYCKPFLISGEKSDEEVAFYIESMVITKDPPENLFYRLGQENLDLINEYIGSTQSATTFSDSHNQKGRGSKEIVTSELIYFWMVSYSVPFEAENWNLNRLFSLLRICNIKNSKQKPMSRSEIARRNRELNAQRKAQLGTSG